jgi:hypothetical protein
MSAEEGEIGGKQCRVAPVPRARLSRARRVGVESKQITAAGDEQEQAGSSCREFLVLSVDRSLRLGWLSATCRALSGEGEGVGAALCCAPTGGEVQHLQAMAGRSQKRQGDWRGTARRRREEVGDGGGT